MAKSDQNPSILVACLFGKKQESTILCKCGCGQFITNRSAKNVEKGKQNAGYIHGHIWKGKELPQSIKDKMNANRRDNKGEKNPNYGKGLFGKDNPNWQGRKEKPICSRRTTKCRNRFLIESLGKDIRERDGKMHFVRKHVQA